jgi:hypothetical protein
MMRSASLLVLAISCTVPLSSAAQDCQEQKLASQNGPGVMVDRNCVRYEGEFRDGKLNGQGKVTYPESEQNQVLEGTFYQGQLWGQGSVTSDSGREKVEGEFVEGRLNGKGIYTGPDHRRYEGYFYNGRRSGFGKQWTGSNQTTYEGTFDADGNLTGLGIRTDRDGSRLVGEFRDSLPVGDMLRFWPDGTKEVESYNIYGRRTSPYRPHSSAPARPSAATPPPAPQPVKPASAPVPGQSDGGSAQPGQVVDEVNRANQELRGISGK